MTLQEVPHIKAITKSDFLSCYVKNQKPVVIEKYTRNWPAFKKWNLDYIDQIAGTKIVPLYDDRPVNHNDGFNEAHLYMKMSAYIKLLKKQPTSYRIFLYNLMKEVPLLQTDFQWPDMGLKLIKQLPMLFFGGADSKVFMHFDIDYANIMHFQFHGTKQCTIFPPDQSKYLYKVPHSLISREDINFDVPDYEKWPALAYAKGYHTHLKHGDMLYIPEGYWHYMKYVTPGFSMSLRSLPRKPRHVFKAAYNVFFMRHFDMVMRKWKGQKWIDWKNKQAIKSTHKKTGFTFS